MHFGHGSIATHTIPAMMNKASLFSFKIVPPTNLTAAVALGEALATMITALAANLRGKCIAPTDIPRIYV
jgi:hypothetical protein